MPVSQGIVEGKLERRVTPVYPPMARAQGIEGRVVLRGTVAEDGTLDGLMVVSGVPMLARAALDAVAQWRYRPYRLNGKPVRMPTEISVEFKLP
jgi:protein TonB